MDKRIYLELRNRTPSDVSICQKYLCRSILLLCVMCACVFWGEGTFSWTGGSGEVWGFGVSLQMNCKVGWRRGGLQCHRSMFRPPSLLPLVCD